MATQIYGLLALAILLTTVPGCHYYIKAVPDVIISSEPFTPPTNQNIHNNFRQPSAND